MKTIVVNATALDASGALSILRQFVANIPQSISEQWIVFVSDKIKISATQSNVCIEPIAGVKSFIKRFLWDACGVKKWLKQHNIKPFASVSLQNTNFRTGYKIPNYIYYHQSIPFFAYRWSPFKSQERPMWFYKHIYPFFVRIFLNPRTEIFVQLEFIKEGFAQKFGIPLNRIHVVRPTIATTINTAVKQSIEIDHDKINIFYPATPFFYKNHKMLIDAIFQIKNSNFVLYLTCDKAALDYPTPDNVKFMGPVTFEKVMAMYSACDAVVFPSYIETFGLPLIEAASVGCPIIAANLPYSQEVLNGYQGATFVDYNKVGQWSDGISKIAKGKKHAPMELNDQKSWKYLFGIITKI